MFERRKHRQKKALYHTLEKKELSRTKRTTMCRTTATTNTITATQPDESSSSQTPTDRQGDDGDIPIIDMGPWVSGSGSEEEKFRVAQEIYDAFRTIGFVIVVNHGVAGDNASGATGTTAKAFEQSKAFFSLSKEEKLRSAYKDPASNRGYISMGQEKLDAALPDIKETFDIGFEGEAAYQNEWPTEALGNRNFRDAMLACFSEYDRLHLAILRALARGMGLGNDDYFTPLCDGNHQNLRLLHYPECDRDAITKQGQKRGGIHTDYGTLTLVSQQKVSGLVAQKLDGSWASVPPYPGGIVVNVGEMLQRWSNDILRATPHQILDDDPLSTSSNDAHDAPPKTARVPERYSIAFFCNANKETSLECLPVCSGPGRPPRYEPINAHAYLTMRLASTIPVMAPAASTPAASNSVDLCTRLPEFP